MEVAPVLDELLVPVFASIERRPEIADPVRLAERSERIKGCIGIVCLYSDRAVTDAVEDLYPVRSDEWQSDRMTGNTLLEKAEPGQKEC